MLRRYPVLLPDWIEDYIRHGVDRYGLSFSEIIRLQECYAILANIEDIHPEYKPNIATKNILKAIRESAETQVDKENVRSFISKIYFETRKAIEYRTEHCKL